MASAAGQPAARDRYVMGLTAYCWREAHRQVRLRPQAQVEDLFQDAVEALLRVWDALHTRKPPTDLLRIGMATVRRRLRKKANSAHLRQVFSVLSEDVGVTTPSSVSDLALWELVVRHRLGGLVRCVLAAVRDPCLGLAAAVSSMGGVYLLLREILRDKCRQAAAEGGAMNRNTEGKAFVPDEQAEELGLTVPGGAKEATPAPAGPAPRSAARGATRPKAAVKKASTSAGKAQVGGKPKAAGEGAARASEEARGKAKAGSKAPKVAPKRVSKAPRVAKGGPRPLFRPGSAREKVWAALKGNGSAKAVTLDVLTKATASALKLSEKAARKQAGLFLWTFIRKGLLKHKARGEYSHR